MRKRIRITPKPTAPVKKKKIQPRRTSPLEALPNEILQEVFLLSLNLDLQLCSKTIARKLASDHVYEEFAFRVFVSTPQECLRLFNPVRLEKPARLPGTEKLLHLRLAEVRIIQSRLIQSPRFDINVFRRLDQRLEAALTAILTEGQSSLARTDILEVLSYPAPAVDFATDDWPVERTCEKLASHWAFAYYWRATEQVSWQRIYGIWNQASYEAQAPHICRLPLRLLEGPWIDDQAALLHYFVCLTECLQNRTGSVGPTLVYAQCPVVSQSVRKGLRTAAKLGNQPVMEALLALSSGDPEFYWQDGLIASLFADTVSERSDRRDLLWCIIWYSVETAQRLIAMGTRQKMDVFQSLVTNSVWAWIDQNYRHNPDAKWLREKIESKQLSYEMYTSEGDEVPLLT